jgi:hypothetical protein
MKRTVAIFNSVADADKAEDEYYASLSHDERMEIFLELLGTANGWHTDDASERLERVCRIVKFEES